MLDLSSQYVTFPERIELRAFTHGLMPRTVPNMLENFVHDWSSRGVDAWNSIPDYWADQKSTGWWDLPTYLGDAYITRLLGAPDETCIMQPNLHWTMQCVLSSPELWERGDEVLVTEHAFPSVLHSAQSWTSMLDKRVNITRPVDKSISIAQIIEQIDDETALVVLSHVGFTTGLLRTYDELRQLSHAAHKYGALFMIDGYHAAATLPIDVQDIAVDIYAGGLLKEASGSSGNAFVYIRPGLSLTPRISGWFANADPFSFNEEPAPNPSVRRRFLGGTTAIAPLYHAVEGLHILLDAGLPTIREDSLKKTSYAIDRLQAEGIAMHSPVDEHHRSSMLILQIPQADRLSANLKSRGVYTDSRLDKYLRLAPFVWNSKADVEQATTEIIAAIRSGRYRSSNTSPSNGPVT